VPRVFLVQSGQDARPGGMGQRPPHSVKDSVEYVFWLSPSAFPKADNSRVLQAYSKDMHRLIRRGVKQTRRPRATTSRASSPGQGGSIPANVIQCGNNESNSEYIKLSKKLGKKIHPLGSRLSCRGSHRVPYGPGRRGDGPFAGSNTTGAVASSWAAVG